MKIPLLLILFLITIFSLPNPSHQDGPNYNYPNENDQTNPRLHKAYIALQAWKHAITLDPKNFTSNWHGPHVCNYTGVFCAPAPHDPVAESGPHYYKEQEENLTTVAGIDLNHAELSGTLPEELGLLTDLALLHINSNRFRGKIPESFECLKLLFELDVSNNELSGEFPAVVLKLPALKFLDLRFNFFSGDIPDRLFDLRLDAVFVNNNNFTSKLPQTLGNSPVSVLVLANNDLKGCLPSSLTNMRHTLREVIIVNSGLKGCLPLDLGFLKNLTVFDVSFNELVGPLPESMAEMTGLEHLNVAGNRLSGVIPAGICSLPRLENFTYSDNYFCGAPDTCSKLEARDDRRNCIPYRPQQRSPGECAAFFELPVDCGAFGYGCPVRSPPPPPPLPPPPPPPPPPVVVHHYAYP